MTPVGAGFKPAPWGSNPAPGRVAPLREREAAKLAPTTTTSASEFPAAHRRRPAVRRLRALRRVHPEIRAGLAHLRRPAQPGLPSRTCCAPWPPPTSPLLARLAFDRLAALPYAALPIATAISLQAGWPLIYPRKEAKDYGTRAEIEGEFHPGETAVVIDDLATTGASKFEAIAKLTAAGLLVRDVVVLIDRQSGAAAALAAAGLRLHAVFTLTALLDHWQRTAQVPAAQIEAARAFIAARSRSSDD